VTVLSNRLGEELDEETLPDAPVGPRPIGALVRAYVALTKPRVIELLLITTLPVMFLAAKGLPPPGHRPGDDGLRDDVGGQRQRHQLLHRP
jgi:protoheme IX farnesyltransferase